MAHSEVRGDASQPASLKRRRRAGEGQRQGSWRCLRARTELPLSGTNHPATHDALGELVKPVINRHPQLRPPTFRTRGLYAKRFNLFHNTLSARLRGGWSIERAFTEPVRPPVLRRNLPVAQRFAR